MTSAAGVSVRGLSARAGDLSLVRDVDLDVAPGELVTLFGPSGAGKTTIAAVIAGVDRPGVELSGDVRTGGRVAYLPQHAGGTLNPARHVGTVLAELVTLRRGREPRARRRERVRRVLAMAAFDVTDGSADRMLRKYPFEFSGGQRTRLALAQVLTTEPDVLVLDEPTVGLDSVSRAKLVDQLDALRRAGMSIVLVTHDPFVAHRLSDRTLRVRDGRIDGVAELPDVSPPSGRTSLVGTAADAVELCGVSVPDRLHGVDLKAREGETLGIIGVSGAGKSSIARCIAGLLAPHHGTVQVGGQRYPVLRKRSRQQLAHAQHVAQESAGSFRARVPVFEQVAATAVRLRGLGDRKSVG